MALMGSRDSESSGESAPEASVGAAHDVHDVTPAHQRVLGGLVPLIVFLIACVLYLLTMAPEVGPGDSAELALQAYQLGVTHPPGYPTHTLLGHMFTLLFDDPSKGTRILSVICSATAAAACSAITIRLTRSAIGGLFAGLILAVIPKIWDMAVVTAIYNVNLCFVALTLLILVRWRQKSGFRLVAGCGAVYGLSLGAYLANLLFLPGILYIVASHTRRRMRSIAIFVLCAGCVSAPLVFWTYWRSSTAPPLGTEVLPNSWRGLGYYLSGAQFGAMELRSAEFYLTRAVQHAIIFSKNCFGYGVLLGLLGLNYVWRRYPNLAVGLILIFAAELCYFTGYRVPDYYTMVGPAYLVMAVWIGCGAHALAAITRYRWTRILAPLAALSIAVGLFVLQIRSRIERHSSMRTTQFVKASFEILPPDSIVSAGWGHFPSMVYFQRVHGLRSDLTIIERTWRRRYYDFGVVDDWLSFAKQHAHARPVCIDGVGDLGDRANEFEAIGMGWFLYQDRRK